MQVLDFLTLIFVIDNLKVLQKNLSNYLFYYNQFIDLLNTNNFMEATESYRFQKLFLEEGQNRIVGFKGLYFWEP